MGAGIWVRSCTHVSVCVVPRLSVVCRRRKQACTQIGGAAADRGESTPGMWHLLSCHCGSLCGCLYTEDIPSVLLLCGCGHLLGRPMRLAPVSPHAAVAVHARERAAYCRQPRRWMGCWCICAVCCECARCLRQPVAVECVCVCVCAHPPMWVSGSPVRSWVMLLI